MKKTLFPQFRWVGLSLILMSVLVMACGTEPAPQSDGGDSVVQSANPEQPGSQVETGIVELAISFNGRKKDKQIEVAIPATSTVLSVLQIAQSDQALEFQSRGSDATAFVLSIDGIENEKGAGDNWVYRVNGELGNKSSGLFEVKPGDQVIWTFGKYSVNDEAQD